MSELTERLTTRMLSSSLCSTANCSARDDVEHGRVAGVVGDLERDQVGLGGDADVGAARRVARRRG